MELKHYNKNLPKYGKYLLIVPYGIETKLSIERKGYAGAFNRTLWN